MKTLKRLMYLLLICATVFIALEFSKCFRSEQIANEILEDAEIFKHSEAIEMDNLPDVIFNKEYLRWKPNNQCAKFPRIEDIKINNVYWQVLAVNSSRTQIGGLELGLDNLYLPSDQKPEQKEYYQFGAYFDSRGPDVKILAMTQGTPRDLFCNIWFSRGIEPKVVQATYHYIWNKDWKWKPRLLNPYLFTCQLPANWMMSKKGHFPKAVSLTGARCDKATNLLKVNHPIKAFDDDNRHNDEEHDQDLKSKESNEFVFDVFDKKPKDFIVCVKGLDFSEDVSYELIEWIELIRLLGADKIHFYILNIHENVAKVLLHYKQVGWIITEGLSVPGPSPTKRSRPQEKRHELIPYNDCFYKHREDYKYVVLLDVDEIILPSSGNWKDLLDQMKYVSTNASHPGEITSTFSVPNIYFFNDIMHNNESNEDDADVVLDRPENVQRLPMLRSLHRTRNITQPSVFVKGFHNASDVLTLHNHFPIECVRGKCSEVKIHEDVAKLAHYRSCPAILGDRCDALRRDYIRDDGILRFRRALMKNVGKSARKIGLNAVD